TLLGPYRMRCASPLGGRMERHGLSSPIVTVKRTPTGELSPMAFLVGVALSRALPVTPTRCVQRLGPAVVRAVGSAMADPSRGRIALPPPGGGEGRQTRFRKRAITSLILQHPGILGSPALARVDDQGAFAQGDAREATGREAHPVADQDEGA